MCHPSVCTCPVCEDLRAGIVTPAQLHRERAERVEFREALAVVRYRWDWDYLLVPVLLLCAGAVAVMAGWIL